MYVPFNIALFVTPLLFLVYLYHLIKYLSKRKSKKIDGKIGLKMAIVVISLVVVFSILVHQALEVSTSGIFVVEKKLREDRKYYIVFNDQQVKVSYNEFQLVEENRKYLMSYVWNKRTPSKGKPETIEPIK